jgi:ParB family transcriptional regulator, chromosome partitioning protein
MSNIKELSVGRTDLYMLDPNSILIDEGFNVRIDTPELREHIDKLAVSIASIGVKQPLTVYWNGEAPVLTDGFCRLSAVKIANTMGADITSVPVRMEAKYANDADKVESLLTRNSGRPLTLLEQSDVIKRLIGFGKTEENIAGNTGYSISHIKNLILLASADTNVRALIINDTVSASNAIEAIRKFGAKAFEALTEAVKIAEGDGKKKVTQKQLKSKTRGLAWKDYGPKCRDMLHLICFSAQTKEVLEANIRDAKELLREIQELEE